MEGRLLLRALREPEAMRGFAPAEWDLVLRQARHANTLGHLWAGAQDAGILDALPAKVRERLEAARAVVEQQNRLVRWEVTRVRRALARTGAPIVLLKGSAYLLAGLPPARGRLFADVDLLVPRERLLEVEETLLRQGWEFVELSPYDERYYRAWSHELPPMEHKDRHIIVDVHHNILPPTGRLRPDPARLLEAACPLPGSSLKVLAPPDMVLHSACHLFQSGELHKSLRDLTDLDALLRHFGATTGFWERLIARAAELGVARPLYYAVRFAGRLLGTPVPLEAVRSLEPAAPPGPVRAAMDLLVTAATLPEHPGRPGRRGQVARWLLDARYHWLRMPPRLLARHLLHKALAGRGRGA